MDEAPPSGPGIAERATSSLAGYDDAVNGLHDALNEAVPWLWAPLAVPEPDQRLEAPQHLLYAAHAGLAVAAALVLRRRGAAAVLSVAAVASWAVFTGAWNRRADQAASAARRAR